MGQGVASLPAQCCAQDFGKIYPDGEFRADTFENRVGRDEDHIDAPQIKLTPWDMSLDTHRSFDTACSPCACTSHPSSSSKRPVPLESLSYSPVKFEQDSTIDEGRSQDRYTQISVFSMRVQTARQSRVWEDWIRSALKGRSVTRLEVRTAEDELTASGKIHQRVPATYQLDQTVSSLSLVPKSKSDTVAITIDMDDVQVICAAVDHPLFQEQFGAMLNDVEKSCAVIMQYRCGVKGEMVKRICILEESEDAKERFVKALTAIWLGGRNTHSLWF